MMDLELPPPGLQSQQVLPQPSGPLAVPRSGQELEGTVAPGGRDSLSQDYDGRAWELPSPGWEGNGGCWGHDESGVRA